MQKYLSIPLILVVLTAIVATACSTTTPTPRPATPTIVAPATLTPASLASATPTTAPATQTATVTLTPTATITPSRTTAAATSRPAASPTPRVTATVAFKPPALRGNIAFHINKDGVDRSQAVNVESTPFNITPFFDIGPGMDVAGSPNRGATNAHWGDWSPDNSKFAFILTSGANASQILRIWDLRLNAKDRDLDSSDTGGGLSSPAWSADGTKIAYILRSADDRLWKVKYVFYNATSDPTERVHEVCATSSGPQFRGGISWGKSGLLALAVNTTGLSDIHTMFAADNSCGTANLTNNPADDSNPVWSPDGKQIAFSSTRDGNSQIYVMNADGTGVRRLSKNAFKEFSPSWSADGNWLAFTSVRDGLANIFVMDKNGGTVQQITKEGGDNPIWSH